MQIKYYNKTNLTVFLFFFFYVVQNMLNTKQQVLALGLLIQSDIFLLLLLLPQGLGCKSIFVHFENCLKFFTGKITLQILISKHARRWERRGKRKKPRAW